MDKKALILENVKRLIGLGIPDADIVRNLVDVGIPHHDAITFLAEAKTNETESSTRAANEISVEEKPTPVDVNAVDFGSEIEVTEEKDSHDRAKEMKALLTNKPYTPAPHETLREKRLRRELAQTPKKEKPIEEKPRDNLRMVSRYKERVAERKKQATLADMKTIPATPTHPLDPEIQEAAEPTSASSFGKKVLHTMESQDEQKERQHEDEVSNLWKKGIIVTVNEQLTEMKRIKNDLNKEIADSVAKAMQKEDGKIDALFEARKTMLSNKIDIALETKINTFDEAIESRLEELRLMNSSTNSSLEKLKAEKAIVSDVLQQVTAALQVFNETKAQFDQDSSAFTKASKERVAAMDERISRTLELESKITEGLIQDAKKRMEDVLESRITVLEKSIQEKIDEVETLEAEVNPEKLRKRIDSIVDEKFFEVDEKVKTKTNELDGIRAQLDPQLVRQQIDAAIAEEIKEITTDMTVKMHSLEALASEMTPEEVDRKIKELAHSRVEAFEKVLNQKISMLEDIEAKVKPDLVNANFQGILDAKLKEVDERTTFNLDRALNTLTEERTKYFEGTDSRIATTLTAMETKLTSLQEMQNRIQAVLVDKTKEFDEKVQAISIKSENHLHDFTKSYQQEMDASFQAYKKETEQGISTMRSEAAKLLEEIQVKHDTHITKVSTDAEALIAELNAIKQALDLTGIESQINDVVVKRVNSIEERTDTRLERLKRLEAVFSPKKIEERIDFLTQDKLQRMADELDLHLNKVLNEALAKRQESIEIDLNAFKVKALEEMNVTKLNNELKSLESFKQRFIKIVEGKIFDLDEKIKEFNTRLEGNDSSLKEKFAAVDSKMKELTDFEKAFAKQLSLDLDTLHKKNKSAGK